MRKKAHTDDFDYPVHNEGVNSTLAIMTHPHKVARPIPKMSLNEIQATRMSVARGEDDMVM
jgi:hypothetical protein